MSNIKIAPSILSADFTRLGEDVREVLAAGASYIHVDVMDGMFVPNISIGVPVVKSLRRAFPDVLLDVHLMIAKPMRYVDAFVDAGADHLMFHVESDEPENVDEAIRRTWSRGAGAGIAMKPKTPVDIIRPWLNKVDMVLVMTVEPGFGGQSFMDAQLPKIRAMRKILDAVNPECDIEVDGGIRESTAPLVVEAGANVLVAGSAVFGAPDRAAAIRALRYPVENK